MTATVDIQNASRSDALPTNELISKCINRALDEEYQNAEISLRIVDEQEIQELNHKWRNKNCATNVLSFPIDKPIEHAPNLLGDIVICAPVVLREAEQQKKDIDEHWAHLIIHGILHLQGYEHGSEQAAQLMEAKEIRILECIGYTKPYRTE